jgi:hypothetical protein
MSSKYEITGALVDELTSEPATTRVPPELHHWCALALGGVYCEVCARREELVRSGWFAPDTTSPD